MHSILYIMKILKTFHISVIFTIICIGTALISLHAEAGQSGEDDINSYMMQLINDIRENPLGNAEALGFDRQTLISTLPWMQETYSPYTWNDFLQERAKARNLPDAELAEPAVSPDCDFVRTGESGGVLSFLNFFSTQNAAKIIVQNMFKQELNPLNIGTRYILTTRFNQVGADLAAGVEETDQGRLNAYYITFCFASHQLTSEVQLLSMINQARTRPAGIVTYLQNRSSLIELFNNNLELLSQWFRVYSPLMESHVLDTLAVQSAGELVDFDLPDTNGALETTSVLQGIPSLTNETMAYTGTGLSSNVAIKAIPTGGTSADIAETVFFHLLENELAAAPQRGAMFSETADEAGTGIALYTVDDQVEIVGAAIKTGTTTSGNPDTISIYGVVFNDENQDGIYSPGEELPLSTVTFTPSAGEEDSLSALSCTEFCDNAGHFTLSLPAGHTYQVTTISDDQTLSLSIHTEDGNMFLPLSMPASVKE